MKFRALTFLLLLASLPSQAQTSAALALPALSRQWHGSDYQAAADAMTSGAVALPRYTTPEGTKTLNRITSSENLEFQRDANLPVQARLKDFLVMQGAVALLLKQYYIAANNGEDIHEEIAAVMAIMLHTTASGASLLTQFVALMPRDAAYEKRMEGLKQVQSGMTNIFLGAEASLSERSFYEEADLSLILDAIASATASMRAFLAPDVRQELIQKFERHRKDFHGAEDQKSLGKIIGELRA